jgi:ABC-type transporter Mla maintaining outer membrane lipid asymmetry ATPase subunit MlaF
MQNLDVPTIMGHTRSGKRAILKQVLLECAKIIGAIQSVTREELNEIFRKVLTKACKESVMVFIHSFV